MQNAAGGVLIPAGRRRDTWLDILEEATLRPYFRGGHEDRTAIRRMSTRLGRPWKTDRLHSSPAGESELQQNQQSVASLCWDQVARAEAWPCGLLHTEGHQTERQLQIAGHHCRHEEDTSQRKNFPSRTTWNPGSFSISQAVEFPDIPSGQPLQVGPTTSREGTRGKSTKSIE